MVRKNAKTKSRIKLSDTSALQVEKSTQEEKEKTFCNLFLSKTSIGYQYIPVTLSE